MRMVSTLMALAAAILVWTYTHSFRLGVATYLGIGSILIGFGVIEDALERIAKNQKQ